MKISRRDGTPERRILISMIVDDSVCARISSRWTKEGLFKSKEANLLGSWCVEFYNKYGRAPGKEIESKFSHWADRTNDQDTVSLVEKLLSGLSGEYEALREESNTEYSLEQAAAYFRRVKLKKLSEKIDGFLEDEEVDEAESLVNNFSNVQLGVDAGIDILQDEEAIKAAFKSRAEPLIVYSGALGNFFGSALERDGFIAILAPGKRAKSYTLLDMAWRAMQQRKRVGYFQIGDLTQNQVMRRFCTRAANRPLYATVGNRFDSLNHPVLVPTAIEKLVADKIAKVTYEERNWDRELHYKEAIEACKRVMFKTRSNTPLFRLSPHVAGGLSVKGIEDVLQSWEKQLDWIPDVVVVDYADVLAPIDSRQEKRHQINDTWIALRALSQKRHCLVLTATQSDIKGADAYILSRSNFSENQLKFAHVTGMFGLNQTHEEKELGLWRYNWLVLREAEFVETKCVHVAGCLPLARPCMKSTF